MFTLASALPERSFKMDTQSPLLEGLLTRRSVRRFRPDPVPIALLETVICAAMHAPSAHHRQPWRFVVVAENRQRLAKAMGGRIPRVAARRRRTP